MRRGKFITVEGQDGAGKSTNIEAVQRFLRAHQVELVQTREPGGTPFGEHIRDDLLASHDQRIGSMAELLLIFAARAQHIDDVIEPALAAGKWVLCDRFTDATYAYQGAGRELGAPVVATLEQSVQGTLRPDLTLLLDLPVELGQSRADQRSRPDRFEQQQIEFKRRVRECYLQRAQMEPRRIKIIDASQALDDVKAAVINEVSAFVTTSTQFA